MKDTLGETQQPSLAGCRGAEAPPHGGSWFTAGYQGGGPVTGGRLTATESSACPTVCIWSG